MNGHPSFRTIVCLPVASMLTTDQNTPNICNFHLMFRHSEAQLYGQFVMYTTTYNYRWKSSPFVICANNQESVLDYHERCYRIVSGKATSKDLKMTNAHICS